MTKLGGDGWSRTNSALRAADLQSTGVTNFPTSPNSFYHIETHFGYCTKQKLSTTVETAEMRFYMVGAQRIEL